MPRLLLAAAATALNTGAAAVYTPVTSVLLTDAVAGIGARCLDGSPQRYWIQKGTNVNKWSWHFMGGGWCESIGDCAGRAYDATCIRGSSNPGCYNYSVNVGNGIPGQNYQDPWDLADIPSSLGARWAGGLMNTDPTHNPATWDWNKVWVQVSIGTH